MIINIINLFKVRNYMEYCKKLYLFNFINCDTVVQINNLSVVERYSFVLATLNSLFLYRKCISLCQNITFE